MFNDKFLTDLIRDERILWTGQPDRSVKFCRADVFVVPFSLLWGGFMIFWEYSVVTQRSSEGQSAPLFMMLWGIPFVFAGLYFIFGRFLYKDFKKGKTYYAVTTKRVLILTELINKSLQAEYIDALPSINKTIRKDGIGTLVFGNVNSMAALYGNTGMEFFTQPYGKLSPTFYDIRDAQQVYDLVNDIRNKPR